MIDILKHTGYSNTTSLLNRAIYLNEPLAEGESISSRSAGVSIPTINGTTILSVDTIVQPSRIDVALTSKQSKMADSMLKYFSYKYGILKRAGLPIQEDYTKQAYVPQ